MSTREADRAEQADLAQALLHAQTEEEAGQEERRHHQEEAEVDEVLAEVGRSPRGAERVFADALRDEAEPLRLETRSQSRFKAVSSVPGVSPL